MAKKQTKISEQKQIDQARKMDDGLFDQLSEKEKEELLVFGKRLDAYKKPVKFIETPRGGITRDPDFRGGIVAWLSALTDATGTLYSDAGVALINQAASVSGKFDAQAINIIAALMKGIAPKDEVEGMLVSQMVVCHKTGLELLREGRRAEYVDNCDRFIGMATKLLRTFTAQVEALKKYRSKGEQKVVVEHVHVHQGGQAIVGTITQTRGEGVADEKQGSTPCKRLIEQENRTTLELPRREAVRCENEAGKALPHASHAKREV
ncbi:MAG: hypothetical protein ABSF90_19840 [Syntrophobacteraceae bacterium]|jgi:hypothetical protein